MTKSFAFLRYASLAAAAATYVVVAATPAQAVERIVDGQAYWSGPPAGGDPTAWGVAPYWAGGQYKYDPYHYSANYTEDAQTYSDTVYAPHAGSSRCVWRQRVLNTEWEYRHPYIRVCR